MKTLGYLKPLSQSVVTKVSFKYKTELLSEHWALKYAFWPKVKTWAMKQASCFTSKAWTLKEASWLKSKNWALKHIWLGTEIWSAEASTN